MKKYLVEYRLEDGGELLEISIPALTIQNALSAFQLMYNAFEVTKVLLQK